MTDVTDLGRFGLLLVRPGMLVVSAPVFSGSHVPHPVRIALTVLLAVLLAPLVPVTTAAAGTGLFVLVAAEAAMGLALGMGVRLIVAAADIAGHLIGFQVGLSYAAIVDPQSGVRNNVLAALYVNMALVTFLALNGHHALVRALRASYDAVPIGGLGLTGPIAGVVAGMFGLAVGTGVRMAAPVIASLLLVEITLGLISRVAPSVNLMVVGTPLRLLAGLAAIAVGVQVVPGLVRSVSTPAVEAAVRLLGALR